jgi:hypothetical protein
LERLRWLFRHTPRTNRLHKNVTCKMKKPRAGGGASSQCVTSGETPGQYSLSS